MIMYKSRLICYMYVRSDQPPTIVVKSRIPTSDLIKFVLYDRNSGINFINNVMALYSIIYL